MAVPLVESDPRIPVTIVTGFLGSGKTTLLSSLLRRAGRERIAIIINEFGEVSLDEAFVDAACGKIVTLAGGCLCCAIAGDIVSTLVDLHRVRSEQGFDRVVIETSGLANPGPIARDLLDAPELTLYRLDGIVCMVDALQGLRELERQRVSANQIAVADRLVLTKTDIAAPHAVPRLRERLVAINPTAPLVVANNGAVDIGWLLDADLRLISWAGLRSDGHDHHDRDLHGIRSFCLWLERRPHLGEVRRAISALMQAHGEKILRIKGLLNLPGETSPTAIHGIGNFLHPPEPLGSWPSEDRRSRIVFIVDRLTEEQIAPFFEAFGIRQGLASA